MLAVDDDAPRNMRPTSAASPKARQQHDDAAIIATTRAAEADRLAAGRCCLRRRRRRLVCELAVVVSALPPVVPMPFEHMMRCIISGLIRYPKDAPKAKYGPMAIRSPKR